MKRRIILFLLNLIGGKKNQETEEETHSRRLGCGCLFAIAFVPFLPILLFIIIIVWVSSSLMSCMAPVVLSDVFGVQITEKDEKMLCGEYQEQKERYGGVQEYFEKKKLHQHVFERLYETPFFQFRHPASFSIREPLRSQSTVISCNWRSASLR